MAFFQSQVAQNNPQPGLASHDRKDVRPIMQNVKQGSRGAPGLKPFEPNKPPIVVPKQGQGQSTNITKTKLAPLNPQLPPIGHSSNSENIPPQSAEFNSKMSFKEKVGMLASLKSGPMAVSDYKTKKPVQLEPMSPRPYEPLPELGPKKNEPVGETHAPCLPTMPRKGIRRPTGLPPAIKHPHA